MKEGNNYWFPAKTYGWGWGIPTRWQGWIVLLGYVALLTTVVFLFPPEKKLIDFIATETILTAILIAICWKTGEPPKWRWGDKK